MDVSAVRDVFGFLFGRLMYTNNTRADLFQSVHFVLEGNASVLLRLETLLVAAEIVALAVLNILLDLPEAVFRLASLVLHDLRRVRKSEANKGSKVTGQKAAIGGEVVPDDRKDGAERAADGVYVGGDLLFIDDVVGRVDGGIDVGFSEVPDCLLQRIVL